MWFNLAMRVLRVILSLFVLATVGWGFYQIWLNSGEHAQALVLVAVILAQTSHVVFAYVTCQSIYQIVDAIAGFFRDRKPTSPPSEAA